MIDLIRLLHSFFKNHNKNNILTICGQRAQNCAGCRYRPWPRCRHGKGLWLARLLTLPISNAGIPAPKIFGAGIFFVMKGEHSHSQPSMHKRSHSQPLPDKNTAVPRILQPFTETHANSQNLTDTSSILKKLSGIGYGWL